MQKESADNLKAFKQVMDKHNVPFCLFLGTALGAYRDHDFCEGDFDDIDVAVDASFLGQMIAVSHELKDLGFYMLHQFENKDGVAPEWSYQKDYKDFRSKIDIFFLSEVDGKLAWRFYLYDSADRPQTRLIDKRFFEQYEPIGFYGEQYFIPSPIEDYLKANYGEWQIKIPRTEWVWYKDNKCTQTT